ncbi:hypothetical protein BV25DRAFT_1992588 [Artomyces pyxidatus]|uniref:Uncharacterized protein n=1 Tax=Artomyces pyxidatus TaxID=48021 RepID=A0ACB8SY37_9AGAM|nr:hypothetical protein BV25DRAFT_1992588 [Artomyces pyxidatus]
MDPTPDAVSDAASRTSSPLPELDWQSHERILELPYTPPAGAYIVFTLDPVATLEALNDPLATEQARALSCRSYVGCLVEDWDLASPYRRYNKCTCVLLNQGPPQASAAKGVDETMCIPIAPAMHSKGRRSVVVSPPLPWDNLYHHTLHAVHLRLPLKAGDYRACSLLPEDDIYYLNVHSHDDGVRSMELRRIYISEHPSQESLHPSFQGLRPVPVPPQIKVEMSETSSTSTRGVVEPRPREGISAVSPLPTSHAAKPPVTRATARFPSATNSNAIDPEMHSIQQISTAVVPRETTGDAETSATGDHSLVDVNRGAVDDETKSEDPVAMMMLENAMGYERPEDRFLPVAHFSLDISVVTEFCDGLQMQEEIAAIKRIRLESEQRTRERMERAERERLERWALDVVPFSFTADGFRTQSMASQADLSQGRLHNIWLRMKRYLVVYKRNSTVLHQEHSEGTVLPPSESESKSSTMSRLLSFCTFGCISLSNASTFQRNPEAEKRK